MLLDIAIQHAHLLFMGTTALSSIAGLFLLRKTRALEESCRNSNETLNNLQEGFYTSSLDGKQLSANPALVRMNGYKTEQELLNAVHDIATEWYVDPTTRDQFVRRLFENGKITNFVSEIYRHKTRERIWISENARLVCDPITMEPLYYEGTVHEISDEIKHRQTQERLNKLADNLPGGLFQLQRDPEGKFTTPYVSSSFLRLLYLDYDPSINNPNQYLKYIHPEDLGNYLLAFKESAEELQPINEQFRYIADPENYKWLHVTATPERTDDGSILWHGHVGDITYQKQVEQEYERLAYNDTLTGLPTRTVLEDKLVATIRQCNRRQCHAALLFIDLDNFKTLNDTRGHDSGDELLRQIAERLKNSVRKSDIVSRYGGDEFIILIDGLEGSEEEATLKARLFAQKILTSFDQEFDLDGYSHMASSSIGISLVGPDLPGADEIARQADSAMYTAKKNGRNQIVVFGERQVGKSARLISLEQDLITACEENQFELVFQPQFSASGELTGAEAFIRWNHPEHGTLTPPEFMPMAERNGLIVGINDWVLSNAIRQIEAWKQQDHTARLRLAININVQQFSTPDFAENLVREMSGADIDPRLLTFELNETVLNRGIEQVQKQMLAIKQSGIRFSLDDFGTGSSSLSSLNSLPFDEIKIDGHFVTSIESEACYRSLIEGILSIASVMKLETVAEHVTSAYQEKYLRKRGCNRFQGYYYAPPLSIGDFEELARSSTHSDATVADSA